MRVRIEVHGHQTFHVVEGEALHWGSTAEPFNQGRDLLMVPCVVIKKDDGDIEVVSLKTAYTNAKAKAL